MIWKKHTEEICIPLRHYIGVHERIQTYGALDIGTGRFVANLSTTNPTTAVDPRALEINGATIIEPRTCARLTGMTFTPTPGQTVTQVDIWKTGKLKQSSSRRGLFEPSRRPETSFWADFARDVFLLGQDHAWELFDRAFAMFHRETVAGFAVLASPSQRYHFREPDTRPDISWAHRIQKLALRKETTFLGRSTCLTLCDKDTLVHLKGLRVVYLVVASNPDCRYGRPYTWPSGLGSDVGANDGFMPVETFQMLHPEKNNGECACVVDGDLRKYEGYKQEVEKFFQGLEVPQKAEVKLVVDPYGG